MDAVRRSWLAAFRQARVSVRAGVSLDDFLRSRLTRYLAVLPVPPARLPLAVAVSDGRLVVRAVERPPGAESPDAARAPPADDLQRWLAPLAALEGPAVRQEVAQLEIRLSVLDGEIEAARRRGEELSRRFAAEVAGGTVAAPPAIDATAEQMGRPPVLSSSPYLALLAFLAATLLATAWQAALPLLRAAGLDPSALGSALEQRPAEAGFVAVFALGVAAGLFALADAALAAAVRLFRGDDDPRRRRFLAAGAGAAALFSVLAGAALAALRAPGGAPGWAFVLLLLVLPVGSTLLLRFVRAAAERRAVEAAAALGWDRERARALADRARRFEEIEWAHTEERELARQREAARQRLRDIDARAVEAAWLEADAAERERADLAHLAQSLVAALDLDRFEFIRQASARGAAELYAPQPPAEAHPGFDAAAAEETGRLVS